MLNCNTKSITLEISKKEKLQWEGVYKLKQTKIVSSIWARKLVGQSCFAYLVHIQDVDLEYASI